MFDSIVVQTMDPVRSSLVGGIAATAVVTVLLWVADFLLRGVNVFVFATFESICVIGGPPLCEPESSTAMILTFAVYVVLFAIAWPLMFAGFTWGLPGESGTAHGAVYGLILWAGYVAVVGFAVWRGWEPISENTPLLAITLGAYLIYGLVLGSTYDYLAGHRTLLG